MVSSEHTSYLSLDLSLYYLKKKIGFSLIGQSLIPPHPPFSLDMSVRV